MKRRDGSSASGNSDNEVSSNVAGIGGSIFGMLGGIAKGGFDADRYGDGILNEAMLRVRLKMLEESEILYIIGVLKKNGVNKEDKKMYF